MKDLSNSEAESIQKKFLIKKRRVFTFFFWLFGHPEKQLDKKAKVKFEIYNVTDWKINNCNKHIAQYLKK